MTEIKVGDKVRIEGHEEVWTVAHDDGLMYFLHRLSDDGKTNMATMVWKPAEHDDAAAPV